MKTLKYLTVFSSVVLAIISIVCLFNAITYEIDVYDFADVFGYLKQAIIFAVFAIAFLLWFIVLYIKKYEIFNIEKNFIVFLILICLCVGSAYFTNKNANRVYSQSVISTQSYLGYEYHTKYLPYYRDVFDSADEKGTYEIFKGDSNNTSMVYVCFEINNMRYELEYLDTNSSLIKHKFLTERMHMSPSDVLQNGNKQVMTVNETELEIYEYNSDYAVYIHNNGNIFYATLANADNVTADDFAQTCIEQFSLMRETVDSGELLLIVR